MNNANNTKYVWKKEDPTTGLSFPVIKKVSLPIEGCGDTLSCQLACKEKGGKLNKDGTCFTFDVLTRICEMVDMLVSDDGRSEALSIASGCYNGNVAHYERAIPDKQYKFDYVPVEVRNKYDPYTVWAGSSYKIN